jgi:ubiquinone biosynthesis protein
MSSARRLRLALTQLGPSFIKLGQILSARADLLPPEMTQELRRLQDEGPTVPFDQVRGLVESELGRPLEQLFASFDDTALSSASLGQVHAAVLRDGREVVVKILRPGVAEVVQSDLQVFRDVAFLLDRQVPAARPYDLPAFVRQFSDQIESELTYTVEAHSVARIRQNLREEHLRIWIPEVIWPLTTRRVLTMDRLLGRRADRLEGLAPEVERGELAARFGHLLLHQIFVDGFFHGDPHQGNVLIGDDGRIGLLDFGLVGYLDPKSRHLLAEVLRCVSQHDVDGALSVVTELGSPRPETDLVSLRQYLARIIIRSEILPRSEFSLGDMLSSTIRAMSLHLIRVPTELSLAAKALLVAEAVCTDLDPSFDFREVAAPVVTEARARATEPGAIVERAGRAFHSAARQLTRLPRRLDTILSLLERGVIRVRMEDRDADRRTAEISRSLNRIALGLVASSLMIVGTLSMVLARSAPYSGLGVMAIAIGAVLGSFVVISILRWGRL